MEKRRKAMLDAARTLLETEPLSMRRLAEVAGVSPATPYNLFGTKRRILIEIYEDLNDDLLARIKASAARDALDRMYEAFRIMVRNLVASPAMYRALIAGVYSGGEEMGVSDPAVKLWVELFAGLRAEGFLGADVDQDAFMVNFIYLLSGALFAWTEGEIDGEALEQAVRYGFTLSMLAVAPEAHRARLKAALGSAKVAAAPKPKRAKTKS
jgi:AcrR family transcriptional regulator